MKRISLAVMFGALVLLAPACGGESEAASVVGNYDMDLDATVSAMVDAQPTPDGKKLSQEKRDQTIGLMKNMFKNGMIEMKDDMSFSSSAEMMGKTSTLSGNWSVSAGAITLNVTKEDGKDVTDKATAKLENDVLSVTMKKNGKDVTMVFNKKK